MRKFLKSSGRYVSVGWFWVLVLLVLPNCGLDSSGIGGPGPGPGPGNNLFTGSLPHTAAIMCDIEQERRCATPADITDGIRLQSAAEALVAGGGTSNIGLDYSPDALAKCVATTGGPIAVVFRGPFPQGYAVCLNCGDTLGAAVYADANAVCAAQCEDFFGVTNSDGGFSPNNPPLPADKAFCEDLANARASTNFPLHDCYADACTAGGSPQPFDDPRIFPELVTWQDVTPNATASPGTLSRSAANSGMWDAGADSTQLITSGDAYVEFVADVTDKARVCGLSSGASDTDASFTDIGYGIDLFSNGQITIFDAGNSIPSGGYLPGDKFRVKVTDNLDGSTATISYVKVTGVCVDGKPCNETLITTSATPGAYPFRVDVSLFDQGAALTQVRLVRIH